MTWVRDFNERLVNIDNWDFLNWQAISDRKTKHIVCFKIYLERKNEQCVLGYVSIKHGYGDEIIEQISKGVHVYFYGLENSLYYYLDKEFDEKFGEVDTENFKKHYEKRILEIGKLIETRFVEE